MAAALRSSLAIPAGLGSNRHQSYFHTSWSSEAPARGTPSLEGGSNSNEDGVRRSYIVAVAAALVMSPVLSRGEERRDEFVQKIREEQPQHLDVEALPTPLMEGSTPTVVLKKAAVDRGRKFCEFALIGRIDFKKMSFIRARTLAAEIWAPSGEWRLIPLGNGFFMLKIDSRDDMMLIWAQVWKFEEQTVRFTRWMPDFDIKKQRSSQVLLSVRLPNLPQQCWDYEALMTMGKALGNPIGVDQRTIQREYGFFANILVYVDLNKPIPLSIKVKEEGGREFEQEIEIPKLPLFCNHCKLVGHEITQCRTLKKMMQVFSQSILRNNKQEENLRGRKDKDVEAHIINSGRVEDIGQHSSELGNQSQGPSNLNQRDLQPLNVELVAGEKENTIPIPDNSTTSKERRNQTIEKTGILPTSNSFAALENYEEGQEERSLVPETREVINHVVGKMQGEHEYVDEMGVRIEMNNQASSEVILTRKISSIPRLPGKEGGMSYPVALTGTNPTSGPTTFFIHNNLGQGTTGPGSSVGNITKEEWCEFEKRRAEADMEIERMVARAEATFVQPKGLNLRSISKSKGIAVKRK